MTVTTTHREPAKHWPSADELKGRDGLVILPDQVEETPGGLTAGFRPDTQELRVSAREQGVAVELYTPEGARRGVYEEHAADWVLPVVISFPVNIACGLIVEMIEARLAGWRSAGSPAPEPEMRCGLLEIDDGKLRVQDLEGPAAEVAELLKELAAGAESGGADADGE